MARTFILTEDQIRKYVRHMLRESLWEEEGDEEEVDDEESETGEDSKKKRNFMEEARKNLQKLRNYFALKYSGRRNCNDATPDYIHPENDFEPVTDNGKTYFTDKRQGLDVHGNPIMKSKVYPKIDIPGALPVDEITREDLPQQDTINRMAYEPEIEKNLLLMLTGQAYDRAWKGEDSKSAAFQAEVAYREEKGYKPFVGGNKCLAGWVAADGTPDIEKRVCSDEDGKIHARYNYDANGRRITNRDYYTDDYEPGKLDNGRPVRTPSMYREVDRKHSDYLSKVNQAQGKIEVTPAIYTQFPVEIQRKISQYNQAVDDSLRATAEELKAQKLEFNAGGSEYQSMGDDDFAGMGPEFGAKFKALASKYKVEKGKTPLEDLLKRFKVLRAKYDDDEYIDMVCQLMNRNKPRMAQNIMTPYKYRMSLLNELNSLLYRINNLRPELQGTKRKNKTSELDTLRPTKVDSYIPGAGQKDDPGYFTPPTFGSEELPFSDEGWS